MEIDQEIFSLSKQIWDYHHLNHPIEQADCIIVLGSHDTRVAERGAALYLQGFAPYLLFSGGLGRLTEGNWTEAEADKFSKIAIALGVPESKILVENSSTNTGENIAFSYKLLQNNGIAANKLLLVQKPYMERRAYASFMKQWPEDDAKFVVTSPNISFADYANQEISLEQVINIMMGDLQRIKVYANKGFQIEQTVPTAVWEAYEKLKSKGFTDHLVEEDQE